MIICTLIVKEEINGGVSIAMSSDQRDATKAEMVAAGVIDKGILAAMHWIQRKQPASALVEGEGIEDYCASYVRKASGAA